MIDWENLTMTDMMKAVEKLNRAGVPTGIAYMPIVPYITDNLRQIQDTVWEARDWSLAIMLPKNWA